jgi:hypothetical protein
MARDSFLFGDGIKVPFFCLYSSAKEKGKSNPATPGEGEKMCGVCEPVGTSEDIQGFV